MRFPVVLFLSVALGAAGCAEPAAPDAALEAAAEEPPTTTPATPVAVPPASPTPAPEPVLTIVTTVAPVADLIAQVAGDRAWVGTVIPPGADSHTYEPRPGDVALFAEADAFIGVGLGLNEATVRLAEEHLPADAPLVLLGEAHLDRDLLVHDHGHDHGHGHDGAPGPNPHVWMSVRAAMELVEGIVDTLDELDPDGSEERERRARAQLRDLRALDEAIHEAVASIPDGQRTLVTYHDAWSYFARDYGLESVTAVQPSDFSEPSAAEVRDIIDLIRAAGVPALFGSEEFPSDVLDAIAGETGATYVGDLADDMLPGEPGDPQHSYVGLMRRNASQIVAALGGDPAPLTTAP